MDKYKYKKVSIYFDETIPDQKIVSEILEKCGKKKKEFITKLVKDFLITYKSLPESDSLQANHAIEKYLSSEEVNGFHLFDKREDEIIERLKEIKSMLQQERTGSQHAFLPSNDNEVPIKQPDTDKYTKSIKDDGEIGSLLGSFKEMANIS